MRFHYHIAVTAPDAWASSVQGEDGRQWCEAVLAKMIQGFVLDALPVKPGTENACTVVAIDSPGRSFPVDLSAVEKDSAQREADDVASRCSSGVIWETGRLLLTRFSCPPDEVLTPESARVPLIRNPWFWLGLPLYVVGAAGFVVLGLWFAGKLVISLAS